jgi:hypothetical protein
MTPEQEEQVRRALAATARAEDEVTPPAMPDAVAARLDGVLAELAQGRARTAADDPEREQDEVARHRARRRLNVLVAAAAVAVIVAAGGAVLKGGSGGSADSSTAGAGSGSAYDEAGPQKAAAPSAGVPSATGSGSGSARSVAGLPALRSDSLAADVRRVVATSAAARPNALGDTQRVDGAPCRRPDVPRGADVVDVRLDGDPATLVVDRATGGSREARVYSCSDGTTPVASATVPGR